ncbi:MAG: glycosyltransferase family 2 protein [Anaerolineae bacterium]|nr:glycosyltransferase family 2 protein [Anaerolineae bacterium]
MNPKKTPFVSVIMPVRNEADFIAQALAMALGQDYPQDRIEVIVADGLSTDRTQQIIQSLIGQHPNLKLINNPQKIVPTGLNAALALAQGEIIIRMDAHCEYPKDYVKKLVLLLQETNAANVGGVLITTGSANYAQKSISAAYHSPLSVGASLRSYQGEQDFIRDVDDVHGGCWRKSTLVSVGLFDEEMVRNQDDELSFRIRKNGGRIIQHSGIQVKYHVRDSFSRLFKQFMQYGYWKVWVIGKHPKQASLRHFAPTSLLSCLISLALLSPFYAYVRFCFGILSMSYLGIISLSAWTEAARSNWKLGPGISLSLITMHFGYGLGFLIGIFHWLLNMTPNTPTFKELTR